MMFEIKHLKTLATLADTGSIKKTADKLFSSQSALSHQIKDLEQRINASLFIRNTSPVQFTPQGEALLRLANDILPKIKAVSSELKAKKHTLTHLNLAIACHACFQWLLPVTEQFSQQYPELKIDFIEHAFPEHLFFEKSFKQNIKHSNNSIDNKSHNNTDILFIDEKTENDNYRYHALGTYEVVAVLAKEHKAITKPFLSAADFSENVLLAYPVKVEELDLFKFFLNKNVNNPYKPKGIKHVANSHMILQMVAANIGIAALPTWLVSGLSQQSLVQTKRIGEIGIYKTLYARYKIQSPHIDIIEQLIPKTMSAFEQINKTRN